MGQDQEVSIAQKISTAQANETLKMLDQLDPIMGEKTPDDDRLPYCHPNVMLVISHLGGGFGRCFTHTRYLSPTHLSVLSKVYMHEGSIAHAYLPDRVGMPEEREGTVTQCNYIYNCMHEVTIQFKHRLNLQLFTEVPAHFIDGEEEINPQHLAGRMLLFSDDEADVRLIMHYLRESRIQIDQAESLGAVLDFVRSKPFDVLACGDMVQGMGVDRIYAALNDAGCSSSLVTICPAGYEPGWGDVNGGTEYLIKPLNESGVLNMLARLLGTGGDTDTEHLYSELPNDQSNAELVEWYIDHVKCLIHSLQKAAMADAVDDARRYITTLRDTASSYGFTPISKAAEQLIKSINASGSISECRDEIQKCYNLTRRMRGID